MSQSAFSQLGNTVVIAATNGASAGGTLPGNGGDAIRVCNRSVSGVYVRWGLGAQTAVALTDLYVPPGNTEVFAIESAPGSIDNVAAIVEAAGTAGNVYFQRGSGV